MSERNQPASPKLPPRLLQPDDRPGQVDPDRVDRRPWYQNQGAFPPEELAQFAGQTVAWWPDGSRIFAAGPDMHSLFCFLQDQGWNPSDFVYDDIPPLDRSYV